MKPDTASRTAFDELGDRMKRLERRDVPAAFDPTRPLYLRLDGRGFSRFTRDMARPFDPRMSRTMIATARAVLEHSGAIAAYVQSDEISLVWAAPRTDDTPLGELPFGGKPFKLASVFASLGTAVFLGSLEANGLGAWSGRLPHFDARPVSLDREDAASAISWRAMDARRNAVQMLARAHFPHRSLQGKGIPALLSMLEEKGVRLSDQPGYFRFGTLLARRIEMVRLDPAVRDKIPEPHRPAEDAEVPRSVCRVLDTASPADYLNLAEVLFDGADPAFPDPVTTRNMITA